MSYEDEVKALWEWYEQKSREYLTAPIEKGCLDSELDVQHHKDAVEYRRRRLELMAKYGIELEGNRAGKKAKEEVRYEKTQNLS